MRCKPRLTVAVAGIAAATAWRTCHGGIWSTQAERLALLPGDDLLENADVQRTHAITIDASPAQVWPWLAQLGQERAGFYSYEWLENLAGCQITNAETIVSEWQNPQVGDPFHLHPAMELRVAQVLPDRALVVSSHGAAKPQQTPEFDYSWAFIALPEFSRTRLLVRERYDTMTTFARVVVHGFSPVTAVMTRGMLLGIKRRAEGKPE